MSIGIRTLSFFMLCAAAFAQAPSAAPGAAQKPVAAAPKLTGFPFSNETLRYSVKWPSGLSLGDAVFTARQTESGWTLETTIDAGIPGFSIKDSYKSTVAGPDLCSADFERTLSHGSKKTAEKTTFDQRANRGHRVTTLPKDGGKTDFDTPSCARDALAFVYYARREMGQGRVAPEQKIFLGGGYSVQMRYTGEMTVPVDDKPNVSDHVVVSVKGPQSAFTFEIFFARDAARTPLVIKVPLKLGTLSAELVR